MAENEKHVVEVSAGRFEVPGEVFTAFEDLVKRFTDLKMPESAARDNAWTAVQAMSSVFKKAAKPEEVVPDLQELAAPVIAKALKSNRSLKKSIADYTGALSYFRQLLEEAGLPTSCEYSGAAKSWVKIGTDVENEDILGAEYKIKIDSDLAKAAAKVPDMLRLAEAHIFSIVDGVAKNEGVDRKILKVGCKISDDGKITLTTGGGSRKPRNSGSGGGGSKYGYTHTLENGTHKVTATRNGQDIGTIAEGKTAEMLEAALKDFFAKNEGTYYGSFWHRKDWWPQS